MKPTEVDSLSNYCIYEHSDKVCFNTSNSGYYKFQWILEKNETCKTKTKWELTFLSKRLCQSKVVQRIMSVLVY